MSVSTEEITGGSHRIKLLLAPNTTIIVTRPPGDRKTRDE
jgi:hypothetical protein